MDFCVAAVVEARTARWCGLVGRDSPGAGEETAAFSTMDLRGLVGRDSPGAGEETAAFSTMDLSPFPASTLGDGRTPAEWKLF